MKMVPSLQRTTLQVVLYIQFFHTVAVLTVLRDRGTFGAVTIPFTVEPAGQNDLTSQVSVVSFTAGQTTAV